MNRKDAQALIGWFKTTNVDPDKIMDYFGMSRGKKSVKAREDFRKLAKEIRQERDA